MIALTATPIAFLVFWRMSQEPEAVAHIPAPRSSGGAKNVFDGEANQKNQNREN